MPYDYGALGGMPGDWERRFLATRRLAAGTPVLRDHRILSSMKVQQRLVEILEARLGIDSRYDVRLRLLGEFALSAWRCGARNWVGGRATAHPARSAKSATANCRCSPVSSRTPSTPSRPA